VGASNVRAGGAFVEIFAKDAAFQKSLARIRNQLQSFGQSLRSLGTLGLAGGLGLVAPLAAATKSFADAGSEISDMAARTGLSTDALQELAFAAKQSGTSLGAVEKGIRKMQQAAASKGISPEEAFMRMADKIADIEDPAKRTALAIKTFGKAGAELIPLLSQGADGMEELRAQARDLGLVMSATDIAAADELGDSLDALWDTMGGVKNMIGASLAPMFNALAGTLTSIAAHTRYVVDANRGLIQGALIGGVALAALGSVLLTLGVGLQVASFALGGFLAAWVAVGSVLTAVAGSPLLLVISGVTALGVALPAVREAAGEVFRMFYDGFSEIGQIANDTFGAIVQAMTQGDMQAAADVLWAGLKVAWLAGTAEIRQLWRSVANDIASTGVDIWSGFRSAISTTAMFMADSFAAAFNAIAGAWVGTQNIIAGGFARAIALITGQDAGEVLATLQDDQDRAAEKTSQGIAAGQAARDKASKDRLAQIEDERKAMQDSLGEELKGQNEAAQAELTAAREALSSQTAAIEAKKSGARNAKAGTIGAADSGLSGVSLGSFSSRNIGQQSIAGFDKVAEATEATAENTEEIATLLRTNGVAFT